MPKITYVHADGARDVLDVAVGTSVMRGAILNGIDGIVAECGGEMMCATCHVYVEEPQLPLTPTQSDDEKAMLEFTASERKPNSRLSCQLVVSPEMDGLVVYLPRVAGLMSEQVVAIVGAGQAGFQTASSLRQEGFAGHILLIGDEPVLPYQRPPLSKSYLAGESGLNELWLRPENFYEKQRIELVTGANVMAIDRRGRRLRMESGDEIAFDHLVLATGARNRPLPVPGAELDGVLALRTLADADILRERLADIGNVVVVGAGFIGLEFASVAIAAGAAVHIVELTQYPMGRVVSAPVSGFFAEAHRRWGAKLSLGTGVTRILGDRGRVAGVETGDGRHLPADLVLICVGVIPNAELADAADLAIANGIAVDEYLTTGEQAIFAIGDNASFPTRFAEGRVRLESVQNAVDQARCAAAHIAGKKAVYDKVPWFWSDQRELKLQIAGLTPGHDAAIIRGDPESGAFSVFCFRTGRLIGVELVNRAADHIAARRILAGEPRLTPAQAADESYDLRAHTARKS